MTACLFLSALSAEAAGGKLVNGSLFVPALEFRNDAGQAVLLVGMIHGGTSNYYARAEALMSEWLGGKSGRTTILKEFATCESEAYDAPAFSVSKESLDRVATAIRAQAPSDFLKQPDAAMAPTLKLLLAEKRACVLDLDGKTKRPAYLVDRNRDACESAAATPGMACQFTALRYPEGPSIVSLNADLKLDQEPAAVQLAGIFMYREFIYASYPAQDTFLPFSMYVVMDYRTRLLEREIRERLARGDRQLILPWGAAHAKDLRAFLLEIGFRQTALRDIEWANATERAYFPELRGAFQDPTLAYHYNFE